MWTTIILQIERNYIQVTEFASIDAISRNSFVFPVNGSHTLATQLQPYLFAFDIFLHRFYVHSARNSLAELCPAYLSPSFLHPVLLFTIHERHYDRDRSFLVVEGGPANVNCSTTLMRYSRVKPSHRQAHMVAG